MEIEAAQTPLLAAGCCAPLLRAATRHKFACLLCCACMSAALASITATLTLLRAAPATSPSVVPGWLVERLFHEDGAVSCPWTKTPAADADCRWRRARLEALRADISTCKEPLRLNEAVYAHRGAPLVAPEETEASWAIGVRSGAGLLECDASLTRDGHLICRHSTCDLATTTDVVANHPAMLSRCSRPWQAARPAAGAAPATRAEVACCTYDFTLSELSVLCAAMESLVNSSATRRSEYLLGPPGFRSPYIAQARCHALVPLSQFLRLAREWGVGVVPELKDTWKPELVTFLASIGRDIDWLAESILTQVRDAGFMAALGGSAAQRGLLQTFDPRIAARWKQLAPSHPVLFLWITDRSIQAATPCETVHFDCATSTTLTELVGLGVEVLAPAMQLLLSSDSHRMAISEGMRRLQMLIADGSSAAGAATSTTTGTTQIGTWSFERSGCPSADPTASLGNQPASTGPCGPYWNGLQGVSAFQHADTLLAIDALLGAGVVGIFSDFPAAVSAVANCRRAKVESE